MSTTALKAKKDFYQEILEVQPSISQKTWKRVHIVLCAKRDGPEAPDIPGVENNSQ